MDAVQLIILIALIGLLVWAVQTVVPMPAEFQKAILVVGLVLVVLIVLRAFDLMPSGDVLPRRD